MAEVNGNAETIAADEVQAPSQNEVIADLGKRTNELADNLEKHSNYLEGNVVRNAGLKPFIATARGLANELEAIATVDETLAPSGEEANETEAPVVPSNDDNKTRVLTEDADAQ